MLISYSVCRMNAGVGPAGLQQRPPQGLAVRHKGVSTGHSHRRVPGTLCASVPVSHHPGLVLASHTFYSIRAHKALELPTLRRTK